MYQTVDKKKTTILTRDFTIILIISFLVNISMNMHGSTVSLLTIHLGGDKSSIGMVSGIISISALLFRPLVGNLLDRKGRKLILLLGVLMLAFTSLAYNLVFSIGSLLLLRLLLGIGGSTQGTAIGTVISDVVPRDRLNDGLGLISVTFTVASAVGATLGLYIIQKYNYNVFFTTIFFFSMVAFMFSMMVNYETKAPLTVFTNKNKWDKTTVNNKFKLSNIFEKTALPYSLVNLFIMFTVPSIFTFIPAYALGLGIKSIGSYFIYNSIAFISGRVLGTILNKYWKLSKILILGLGLCLISFIVLAFTSSLTILIIAGCLNGIGSSLSSPALNSMAISKCIPERRGAANATYMISMDLGFCIGSFSWGIIAQIFGYSLAYLISALLTLAAIMIFINVSKYKKISSSSLHAL